MIVLGVHGAFVAITFLVLCSFFFRGKGICCVLLAQLYGYTEYGVLLRTMNNYTLRTEYIQTREHSTQWCIV